MALLFALAWGIGTVLLSPQVGTPLAVILVVLATLVLVLAIAAWSTSVRSTRRERPLRPHVLQLYFQLARACIFVFAIGLVVAAFTSRTIQQPVLPALALFALGIGLWGTLWGVTGYYHAGGKEKFRNFLFEMVTKFRIPR